MNTGSTKPSIPLTEKWAAAFAQEWIAAWNSRDLSRVLSHYTEDVEMSSPFAVKFAGVASGCVKGKARLRAYWEAALVKFPDLRFDLIEVFVGSSSLVLSYQTSFGLRATEVLFVNEEGLIHRAAAHYKKAAG